MADPRLPAPNEPSSPINPYASPRESGRLRSTDAIRFEKDYGKFRGECFLLGITWLAISIICGSTLAGCSYWILDAENNWFPIGRTFESLGFLGFLCCVGLFACSIPVMHGRLVGVIAGLWISYVFVAAMAVMVIPAGIVLGLIFQPLFRKARRILHLGKQLRVTIGYFPGEPDHG